MLLPKAHASRYTGVSRWTLNRYLACGLLHVAAQSPGGRDLLDTDELDRVFGTPEQRARAARPVKAS